MTNFKELYKKERTYFYKEYDNNGEYYEATMEAGKIYYKFPNLDGKQGLPPKVSLVEHEKSKRVNIFTEYDRNIAGTMFFIIFVLLKSYWFSFIKKMLLSPKCKIKDGYALTLISPFILIWWGFWLSISAPIYLVLIILLIISIVWWLFESIASWLNGEFDNNSQRLYINPHDIIEKY